MYKKNAFLSRALPAIAGKEILLACLTGVVVLASAAVTPVYGQQAKGQQELPQKQAWFGEPGPGHVPRLFAPGKISDAMSDRDMAISPAGDELFYTIQAARGQLSVVLYIHFTGGAWSQPEMASFAGRYNDLEPAFSVGGDTLYFSSNRPVDSDDPKGGKKDQAGAVKAGEVKDYDIWMLKKEKGKWGNPARLDTVINSARDEFYPSIARNGNLYFTREMENGKGKEDIVVSEWKNGRYQPPYSLPAAINSDKYEFNAFVDPDERFLLFTSYGREDDLGGGDLYLSAKNGKGEWLPAAHLDSTINSSAIDFCPFVSFDKKYLFFTSGRFRESPPYAKPLDFAALRQLLENPGNGLNDIYWMEWQPVLEKYFPQR
jgi:hypothetical protein